MGGNTREPEKFFSRRGADFISRRPMSDAELVCMPNNEDWLWRPVVRGVLRAESLLDPNIDLAFIADINDALSVQDENEYRMMKAADNG